MTLPHPTVVPPALSDLLPTSWLFRDDFERPDSRSVGNGWTDGSTFDPDEFAPLGIKSAQLCCSDPMAPTDTEKGIGCCWRDLATTDIQATILVTPLGSHFREASPLLHVVPGTSTHGFGAWLSTFHGKPNLGFLLVGTMGNPLVRFHALATSTFPRDDSVHLLSVRSVGGQVTCYFDGVRMSLSANPSREPVDSVAVPEELAGSTLHGLAIDCHLEPEETMADPVVIDSWFEAVG
jgi:hypothetical protein